MLRLVRPIQMQERRNDKNIVYRYLHSYKNATFSSPLSNGIHRKVLQITTNPKLIQPSQINLSNKRKEAVILKHVSRLTMATCTKCDVFKYKI